MHSTITQTELDTIAADLDRAARERAHGMSPSSDGPTAFACDYVRAMAETCGALAADQCATGEEWDPADWLSEDSRAVTQAAELVGVELDGDDWRDLWRLYRAPSDGAFLACGLALR